MNFFSKSEVIATSLQPHCQKWWPISGWLKKAYNCTVLPSPSHPSACWKSLSQPVGQSVSAAHVTRRRVPTTLHHLSGISSVGGVRSSDCKRHFLPYVALWPPLMKQETQRSRRSAANSRWFRVESSDPRCVRTVPLNGMVDPEKWKLLDGTTETIFFRSI